MFTWRRAETPDIPRIAHISSVALAGYPEEEAIFEELLRLAPAGCFVLEVGGEVSGYLVGHPWLREHPPALNEKIGALPDRPDCWYIHDLSLLPSARGFGAARSAVGLVADGALSAGLDTISLVAVNNAAGFWEAQGFRPLMGKAMRERVASYGEDALYMERALF